MAEDKTEDKTTAEIKPEIKDAENLGFLDDIKKTINEIRSGVREKIASVWRGFKDLLSKGFKKLFGVGAEKTDESATAKPAEQTADKPQTADNKAKPATPNPESAPEKPKLEESETFKKVMETFSKEIKEPIKNVLYPASGYMSINDSIKDAKITYVDIDESAVNAHKEAGHNAVKEDMENFKPEEKPDLTILLNPHAKADKIKKLLGHVPKDKHIICNNYHHTAELLNGNENMQLVGVINPDGTAMDRENLDDYFKHVETDEEFKQKDPIQYDKALALIKEKNGDAEKDILKQYKKLTKDDKSGLHRIPFKKGGDAIGFQTWYYVFKRIKEADTNATPAPPAPANTNSGTGSTNLQSPTNSGFGSNPNLNTNSGPTTQNPSALTRRAA